jgi:hypothetical protein
MNPVLDRLLEKTRDLKVRAGARAVWDESEHHYSQWKGGAILATADAEGRVTPSMGSVQLRSRVFQLQGSSTPVLAFADAAGRVCPHCDG